MLTVNLLGASIVSHSVFSVHCQGFKNSLIGRLWLFALWLWLNSSGQSAAMAATLVRPSMLLMPAPSAGLIRELRRLRVGVPSCSLHTVVATEDPVSPTFFACWYNVSALRIWGLGFYLMCDGVWFQSGERFKHVITSGPHTFRGDLSEAWGAGGTAPEYAYPHHLH